MVDIQICIDGLRNCCSMLEGGGDNSIVALDLENILNILNNSSNPNLSQVIWLVQNACALLIDNQSESDAADHSVGRTKLNIPRHTLECLLSLNFNVTKISKILHISKSTIRRRMTDFNLSVKQTYTETGDDELDDIIEGVLLRHPNTGYKRMKGFLAERNVKVTHKRILESLRRVDPTGVEMRRGLNRAIRRRVYSVEHSMDVWHIDTHHKLIRWGIIVRGGIDGKSRAIMYLEAGNNNTALAHFASFLKAIDRFGIPQRTRSDKGGENVDIASFMIERRGCGRGSHICGRSVHNQRIERLWRDVFYGCLTSYQAMFCNMEEEGVFDIDNPKHVAVLQFIFVPRINASLAEFMEAWNRHPLSSENGHTPLQLLLLHSRPSEQTPHFRVDDSGDDGVNLDDISSLNRPIEVEDFWSFLSENERDRLVEINPLRLSDQFGLDIFRDAMNILDP